MLPEFELNGRIAVITGGGRGIGRDIALTYAEAGADVVLAARSQAEVDEVAAEVEATGRRALAVKTDVTDSAQVDALVATAIEKFGQVDIMVNNAGVVHFLPLVPLPGGGPESVRISRPPTSPVTDDEWNHVMDVNVNGVMYGCRAVGPHMLERGSGKVINISSTNGHMGVPYVSLYNVSKAAVNMLTRVLALEWAEHGVQVNALAPGAFHTRMTDNVWTSDEGSAENLAGIPMGKHGDLRDLGLLAVYLGSPASNYMTGQIVHLDGGRTAK
jgi:NAD(P)-dependent dehydrogenase (short-subunit alcohol dehydrogenase family)